jgi:hypothetical protein
MVNDVRLDSVVSENIEGLCHHFFPHGKRFSWRMENRRYNRSRRQFARHTTNRTQVRALARPGNGPGRDVCTAPDGKSVAVI